LAWLKKQHFWVLCVLVALIGLFCWWSAAGTLSAKYDTDEKKIKAEFTNLNTLQSNPFHPNDKINERQGDETKRLAEEVGKLWQLLYDRQSEGVLKWPDALPEAFRVEVEKLQFGQEIDSRLRELYQNYITRHFPKLPEKIGAEPIDPELASGMAGGGGFTRMERGPVMAAAPVTGPDGRPIEEEGDFICAWAQEDQANVAKELDFPEQPSNLRIWVAQENYWVYHTLLNVIKNTNDAAGATRPSNAAVRMLYYLQVGQPAAKYSRAKGRIYKPPTAAPAGGDIMSPEALPAEGDPAAAALGEMPGEMDRGMSGLAYSGSGPMSPAVEAGILLSGRYLDETGKPIPFAGGASADGAPADPSAAAPAIDRAQFGKEYVRIPVRMVVEMDQRHLPRLIAECATQPLQVEVQEVRINVPDALDGQGGMSSTFRSFDGGGMGGGGSIFPILSGLQEFKKDPQIATVVIQGVIYIFNKPNLELLKTDETAAQFTSTSP
jgi:hypothetical protein